MRWCKSVDFFETRSLIMQTYLLFGRAETRLNTLATACGGLQQARWFTAFKVTPRGSFREGEVEKRAIELNMKYKLIDWKPKRKSFVLYSEQTSVWRSSNKAQKLGKFFASPELWRARSAEVLKLSPWMELPSSYTNNPPVYMAQRTFDMLSCGEIVRPFP